MQRIQDWYHKHLTCTVCGTNKSVKYLDDKGKPVCNECILKKSILHKEKKEN